MNNDFTLSFEIDSLESGAELEMAKLAFGNNVNSNVWRDSDGNGFDTLPDADAEDL